jgi:hypothetical protein
MNPAGPESETVDLCDLKDENDHRERPSKRQRTDEAVSGGTRFFTVASLLACQGFSNSQNRSCFVAASSGEYHVSIRLGLYAYARLAMV